MFTTKQQEAVLAEEDYEHELDASDWGTTVGAIMARIELEEMLSWG